MFYIILCSHRVWNLNPSPAVEMRHYTLFSEMTLLLKTFYCSTGHRGRGSTFHLDDPIRRKSLFTLNESEHKRHVT